MMTLRFSVDKTYSFCKVSAIDFQKWNKSFISFYCHSFILLLAFWRNNTFYKAHFSVKYTTRTFKHIKCKNMSFMISSLKRKVMIMKRHRDFLNLLFVAEIIWETGKIQLVDFYQFIRKYMLSKKQMRWFQE